MTVAGGVGRRRASRRPARPGGGDRGASSIELVLYTPVLMLVILLTVQFALSWHGSHVAGAVARETARVARAGGGAPDALAAAHARGTDYAAAIGGNALREVQVVVTPLPADAEVRVTVSGRAAAVVPGYTPRVSRTVQGPLETFRPDL